MSGRAFWAVMIILAIGVGFAFLAQYSPFAQLAIAPQSARLVGYGASAFELGADGVAHAHYQAASAKRFAAHDEFERARLLSLDENGTLHALNATRALRTDGAVEGFDGVNYTSSRGAEFAGTHARWEAGAARLTADAPFTLRQNASWVSAARGVYEAGAGVLRASGVRATNFAQKEQK